MNVKTGGGNADATDYILQKKRRRATGGFISRETKQERSVRMARKKAEASGRGGNSVRA